jgi:hypothetical protein
MPKIYQLHKVADEETNAHEPMLIDRGDGNGFVPATMSQEAAEDCYLVARQSGAYPLQRFPDGRIQTGHFVFVPEPEEE